MIESFQSQLLNYGIISGLYFTILFPLVLSPIIISPYLESFFNPIAIKLFIYIHYCCIYYALMQSLSLIYQASRYYLHLTIWMPNIELKYWYINTIPIKIFIITANSIIKFIILSLSFGITYGVSPVTGLISTVLVLYSLWQHTKTSLMDTEICIKIHNYVCNFFNKKVERIN